MRGRFQQWLGGALPAQRRRSMAVKPVYCVLCAVRRQRFFVASARRVSAECCAIYGLHLFEPLITHRGFLPQAKAIYPLRRRFWA